MFRFAPKPNRARLVRWREWGPEAFQQALDQDKPVMVFLTAFWCYFCQLMDESPFSDDEIIALLNAYFIPVRVEAAQRPDINVRYNRDGWPTIAFLTPQGDHLVSVNYQPPDQFGDVLVKVQQVCQERRTEIREVAAKASEKVSQRQGGARSQAALDTSIVAEVSGTLLGLVDQIHGGYGHDHKYPHVEATELMIRRFETTGDSLFLARASLTLEKMRQGGLYDEKDGGFFRYSSKPDWSEPHHEKLLIDHAGLLRNYLHAYLITERTGFRRAAEELIRYLDATLSDPTGAFYGCQDYGRSGIWGPGQSGTDPGELFSIIDDCIYTDANAQAVSAYLEAWWVLGRPDCKDRALAVLDLLWERCQVPDGGMYHYYQGEPRAPGLLTDSVYTGLALADAFQATSHERYLRQAKEMGEYIAREHPNPDGGFYDTVGEEIANLKFRLTLVNENAAAAELFMRLADLTDEPRHLETAHQALQAFAADYRNYGIFAAGYGSAVAGYLSRPLHAALEGVAGDRHVRALVRAAATRLGPRRLLLDTAGLVSSRGPSAPPAAVRLRSGAKWLGPITDPAALNAETVDAG